jgi:hypothetical protein
MVVIVVVVALAACSKKAPVAQGTPASPNSAAPPATSPSASPAPKAPSPTASPTAAASTSATCAVVSATQVNNALGTTVKGPDVNTGNPPVTVCTYSGGTPPTTVIIRVQPGQDTAGFAGEKAGFNSRGQPTTDVGGYGDEAYTSALPGAGATTGVTTLVARKGSVEVLISARAPLGPIGGLMQKILAQV